MFLLTLKIVSLGFQSKKSLCTAKRSWDQRDGRDGRPSFNPLVVILGYPTIARRLVHTCDVAFEECTCYFLRLISLEELAPYLTQKAFFSLFDCAPTPMKIHMVWAWTANCGFKRTIRWYCRNGEAPPVSDKYFVSPKREPPAAKPVMSM